MVELKEIKRTVRKANIELMIRKSLREFPEWTTVHGKGTYVIGKNVYKRTKIPMSELKKGIAIVIHTHGAKYSHSWADVDDLHKGVLNKQIICMVVLSPELDHYYALYPNFTQANKDKIVSFLMLKSSKIEKMLLIPGMTSAVKEKNKLKKFAAKHGLSLIEGNY